jgi:hypothetical protein
MEANPCERTKRPAQQYEKDFRALARRNGLRYILAVVADAGGLHCVALAPEKWVVRRFEEALEQALAGVRATRQAVFAGLLEDVQHVLREARQPTPKRPVRRTPGPALRAASARRRRSGKEN